MKEMVNYSFANFPIRKLSSPVFEYNVASRRVLEKLVLSWKELPGKLP